MPPKSKKKESTADGKEGLMHLYLWICLCAGVRAEQSLVHTRVHDTKELNELLIYGLFRVQLPKKAKTLRFFFKTIKSFAGGEQRRCMALPEPIWVLRLIGLPAHPKVIALLNDEEHYPVEQVHVRVSPVHTCMYVCTTNTIMDEGMDVFACIQTYTHRHMYDQW
jgi:bacterioferritin-associated ferredoxin